MNYLQLNIPKSQPFRSLDSTFRCDIVVTSISFCFCPRPGYVQLLEVHICARSTQPTHIGLHAKHCVFNERSTRDVDQNMHTRLHQIEPLTMNVLQVGIASGSHASAGS